MGKSGNAWMKKMEPTLVSVMMDMSSSTELVLVSIFRISGLREFVDSQKK